MRCRTPACCIALVLSLCLASTSKSQQVTLETVLDNLDNPCGVAVQPDTGHVFVAEGGAGRIVRVVDGKLEEVIVGFPQDQYGKGPTYKIGPLGLAFIDAKTLVVGGGGLADGLDLLRVYKVPSAGDDAIGVEQMTGQFSLPATDKVPAEGNFHGVAVTKTAIFVTCNGDDTKGWIAKADINGTKIGPFQRLIPTQDVVGVDAPVAITVSPHGYLAVGQMGEIDAPGDGLLCFYSRAGEPLLSLPTGLSDTTGLAYSAKTRLLYAVDFAWKEPTEGGLFRLDRQLDGVRVGLKHKKIIPLDKPTALAFGKEGDLFLTVFGTVQDGSDKKSGKLLRIAPGL